MTGNQMKTYRRENGLTQLEAAHKLVVSQTYLSLLEAGKRPLSDRLARKAARLFDLPPTQVPTKLASGELPKATDDQLAADLADLGYVGFGHLRRKRPRLKNPADVLVAALNAPKRDARVVEGLPWLVLKFPDLDWNSATRAAKLNDLQNRLGYVVDVARQVAEQAGDDRTAELLAEPEAELERSMLAREGTLCNDTMTNAERRWLTENRPEHAKRWHLLADLSPRYLKYA